ncbi:MAG: agmatinase [Methanobacteriaceae archaeon]|jgi:agmatinase|uniref:agmatinase n=1 Tax=unclassified Methanobrevibacter TaxID=2638681 RepID=UPI002A14AB9D|nr:agmatinase [Methanobacteriaceae archaeon]MDD3408360.1 agmatinase [Methanobacteriaceae archaeon]MDD4594272.1 agmatinase [Methanobacteriaceae archaeon]
MLFNTYEPWKFAFAQETSNLEDIKNLNFHNLSKSKQWGIIGVPFDSTCSYHNGSRYAPLVIREASYGFERFNTNFQKNLSTIFYDFGDSNIINGNCKKTCEIVEENVTDLLTNNIYPLIIGGEHSLTLGSIKALTKYYNISEITVIHIDAHRDIIESYQNEKYSHATILRRIHELNPKEIIQIGIRSASKEENDYVKNQKNIKTFTPTDLQTDFNKLINYLKSIKGPIYLTIDMDGLDPSIAPSVGNPTPNGLKSQDISEVMKIISKKEIIGFDLMEVATNKLGDITAVLAAKFILDFLTLLP